MLLIFTCYLLAKAKASKLLPYFNGSSKLPRRKEKSEYKPINPKKIMEVGLSPELLNKVFGFVSGSK